MILLSIVIINYNTFQLTCNCIKSIYQQFKGLDFEIVLVDNASTESNPLKFKEIFSDIILIESPENVGFSKGNNLGIEVAKGKFILLLNSDTELKNDAITPCINYLESNAQVGVVTTKLMYPSGVIQSTCQRFPNVIYNLLEFFRFQKLFPTLGGKLLLANFFDYKTIVKVDWTWGAFFMFPKAILKQLPNSKLNDDFFMYCEDMQWCLDMRKIGKEVRYIPNGEVIHYMGASKGAKKPLMIKNHEILMHSNFSYFHRKLIDIAENLLKLSIRD